MGNVYTKKEKNIKKDTDCQNEDIYRASPKNINKYKRNHKNLICDDDCISRLVLKKYLVYFGCDVDEAEDGLDAIMKVKENGVYDVIWMDIKMPKMDGHQCTYYLRNDMQYTGTIIGLTGYVDDISIKICHTVGMNEVVPKPFDTKIVHTYVKENRY